MGKWQPKLQCNEVLRFSKNSEFVVDQAKHGPALNVSPLFVGLGPLVWSHAFGFRRAGRQKGLTSGRIYL